MYKFSGEDNHRVAEDRDKLLEAAPSLTDLVRYVDENPGDYAAGSRLTAAYMDRGLYWAAYDLLTVRLAAHPNDYDINLSLARIWDTWGEYDVALQHAERAIAYNPGSAQAYDLLGRIQLHRKDADQAIARFTQSIELEANALVFANLGYAHILKAQWEQARANLEKAVELDGDLEEAHNNLAVVLSKSGDDEAAFFHLSKTARPAVALNNMGVLYLQRNKLPEARRSFEESLRLEPTYELAQRNLHALQASNAPPTMMDLPRFEDIQPIPPQAFEGSTEALTFSFASPEPPVLRAFEPRMNKGSKSQVTDSRNSPESGHTGELVATASSAGAAERERFSGQTRVAKPGKEAAAIKPAEDTATVVRKAMAQVLRFEHRGINMAGIAGLLVLTGAMALRPRKYKASTLGLNTRESNEQR